MVSTKESKSAQIRARIGHPIVDADGHIREVGPALVDYVRQVGGSRMAEQYAAPPAIGRTIPRSAAPLGSLEERRDRWTPMGSWWGTPTGATDRATSMVPRLLNERMDELGFDFTILYPSQGLFASAFKEAELRQVASRAYNLYAADLLKDYGERMAPVAVIPMHTPQEAVAELEYAVKTLGYKAVVLRGSINRPIPWVQREYPELADVLTRMELFGLDSDFDYDPVWAKCVELKVAAVSHGSVLETGGATGGSISNHVFNHLGLLGMGHLKLCKALFMGGVTRRFPTLNFAFLEGGVWWACGLYADLVGHWGKRGAKGIQSLDPARLDKELFMQLLEQYGEGKMRPYLEQIRSSLGRKEYARAVLDEFAACGIEKPEDIRDLFARNFYFGCEADDPMTAMAFNSKANPFGAVLKPILGSDIGHWDVPVMNEVVEEAYELVEKGALTDQNFKDFTFVNPVLLHGRMNPDFFKGTRVEAEASKTLRSVK